MDNNTTTKNGRLPRILYFAIILLVGGLVAFASSVGLGILAVRLAGRSGEKAAGKGSARCDEKPIPDKQKAAKRDPAIAILVLYPGMPPDVMERDIMSRLQRWIGQSVGLQHQEAKAMPGVCIVKAFFREDIALDTAMAQVTGHAASDLFHLPPGTVPPTIVPFNPATSVPAGLVCISMNRGAKTPEGEVEKVLSDIAYNGLRDRLQSIRGVFAPTVCGGGPRRIQIDLDREKLAARKLTLVDVQQAVRKHIVVIPAGNAKLEKIDFQMFSKAAPDVEQINNIRIKVVNGASILVRDVGETRDSLAASTRARRNGRRVVCVPIWPSVGANSDEVRKNVQKSLDGIKARLVAMNEERARGIKLEWHALGAANRADAGLLTVFVRAPSGTKLDATEKWIEKVEKAIEKLIPPGERRLIVSAIGLSPDLSAVYSRHNGPESATIRVQLADKAGQSAEEYARRLRRPLNKQFPKMEFSFHAGLSTEPALVVRIMGASLEKGYALAAKVRERVSPIAGAVDVCLAEWNDYPIVRINIDREKAANLGVTLQQVEQLVRATNTSINFHPNFWVDPGNGNQFSIGVKNEEDALDALKSVPVPDGKSIKLQDLASIQVTKGPSVIHHRNLTRTWTVRINVEGRTLFQVAADVAKTLQEMEVPKGFRVEPAQTGR